MKIATSIMNEQTLPKIEAVERDGAQLPRGNMTAMIFPFPSLLDDEDGGYGLSGWEANGWMAGEQTGLALQWYVGLGKYTN